MAAGSGLRVIVGENGSVGDPADDLYIFLPQPGNQAGDGERQLAAHPGR